MALRGASGLAAALFLAAAGTAGAESLGPDLYQGARAGMTAVQLRHAIPDLIPADADNQSKGYDTLMDQRTVGERFPATARFMLKAGHLDFIVLDIHEKTPAALQVDWPDLKLALTSRYGRPLDCEDSTFGTVSVGNATCKWSKGEVSVTLEAYFGPGVSLVNISYEPVASSAGAGL